MSTDATTAQTASNPRRDFYRLTRALAGETDHRKRDILLRCIDATLDRAHDNDQQGGSRG